jgi:hypothetical protein
VHNHDRTADTVIDLSAERDDLRRRNPLALWHHVTRAVAALDRCDPECDQHEAEARRYLAPLVKYPEFLIDLLTVAAAHDHAPEVYSVEVLKAAP